VATDDQAVRLRRMRERAEVAGRTAGHNRPIKRKGVARAAVVCYRRGSPRHCSQSSGTALETFAAAETALR